VCTPASTRHATARDGARQGTRGTQCAPGRHLNRVAAAAPPAWRPAVPAMDGKRTDSELSTNWSRTLKRTAMLANRGAWLVAAAALALHLHGVAAFAGLPVSRMAPCAIPAGPERQRAHTTPLRTPPRMVSAGSGEATREECKDRLRRLVAQTKRGKGANDAERVRSPDAREARCARAAASAWRAPCRGCTHPAVCPDEASPAARARQEEIFRAMEAVETLNPTAVPVDSELLSGKWSLLYTGASAEDAATRRAKEVRAVWGARGGWNPIVLQRGAGNR
jgi:hypothetical protein